ncbi:hypothetical protein OFB94_32055, partial [Escherichia coli]|nr:hypothetical protein [Escherichia coli]
DAIGKITRVAVENARQRGELQPSEQDVIRQFELNKLNKLGERGEILTEPATVTKEISTRRTLDEEFVRNLRIRYGLERDIN